MSRRRFVIFTITLAICAQIYWVSFHDKNENTQKEDTVYSQNNTNSNSRTPAQSRQGSKAKSFAKKVVSKQQSKDIAIKMKNYVERKKIPKPYIPKTESVKLPQNAVVSNRLKLERSDKQYALIENYYAIPKTDYYPHDYNVYHEMQGVYIVEADTKPLDGLAVVAVEGTNRMAVFTGMMRVKFSSADSYMGYELINYLSDFSSRDLTLEVSYGNELANILIGTYHFEDYETCVQAYELLNKKREEMDISRITIEIIEYQRSSN